MNLYPLQDRVVVKLMEAEETTKGGIILTAAAKEKPQVAEVVAVGPGIPEGDHKVVIITSKYAGTEVKMDGVEYTIVKQSDILAIVK